MNNKNKIKRLAAIILPLFLMGGVVLPLNTFAQSYSVEFTDYLQPWGHSHQSYMEKSIYLPSSGRYEVWAYVGANSGAGQLYEEIKVLVDGKYIGHTNDPNTGDDWTNESLGEHDFNAGNRKVRLEHRWNYSEVGSQSVHPQKVTFALVSVWECTPDQTQTEDCGNCGTKTKICQQNHYWGQWSSCQGEGECCSGETQTQSCGTGGSQTRTCQSGCSWGSWGACQGENRPPVANAGPDKEIYENQSVVLNGSGSDPDGDPITYYWTCTGAYLNNQYIAEPTFNAPQVSYTHYYTCTLKVTDDKGLSDSDEMTVLVKDSECTPDQTQTEDCGNCGTKTKICQQNHYWGQWSSCQGEGECCSGETQTQSCGTGGSQTRTCQSGCSWGSWGACQGENRPPVANAGPDKEIYENQSVVLNGSGSDPDGDPITYYWTCTGAYLNNQYIAEPTFNAPQVSYTHYYTCTLKVTDDKGLSDSDEMTVRVLNQSVPTVDIKANYSDGPITINYNTLAVLTWISSNTNSCYASGNWSGTKSTTGSDTTGNLISSRTYSIICSGPGGSASDNVVVNVATAPAASGLIVNKMARNLSRGTNWSNSVSADPGEIVSFLIKIEVTGSSVENLIVKDILPDKIIYQGNLRIDSVSSDGDIVSGLNVGSLSPNQIRTITFDARLVKTDQFGFGTTQLSNGASVYTDSVSGSDTVVITVTKKAVAGAATVISTGLTNNIFLDSFFLPLVITCIVIWFFRSHIIHFGEWLDLRKERYQKYHAKKLLQLKLAQIKAKEFFQKKVIQRF